jgi:hypothetical protein
MDKMKKISNIFPNTNRKKNEKENNYDSHDLKIGEPTDFKHNIQVKHDKERNEYIGLPAEWRALLESNNIK